MVQLTAPGIEEYAEAHTTPPPPELVSLFDETHAALDSPTMLTGPVEGRFLQTLVFALGARRVLEIGTFSGYSALSMAPAVATGGRIVTCEVSQRHAEFARKHFDSSPYADMIEIRPGPALSTIAGLAADGAEPFDFVFIDADKENYPAYFEAVLPLLAPRGLIAADNTLWSGRVLDPADREASTIALRAFNDAVAADTRVVSVMLTVRDGVTLIRHA